MKKENKEKVKFWVIITALLAWLLFSVFIFVYFKTECKVVEENALKYSAEKYNIDLCTCLSTEGTTFFFNKTKVWSLKEYKSNLDLESITEKLDQINITQ